MARKTTGKTKPEIIAEQVAAAVDAGKKLKLESVDFSDPNRPKTCLEVDFPILPINQIAIIEGNAGKPLYKMSKWFAPREPSVFRSMLLAAATKAPEDGLEVSKTIWDAYYGNHQANEAFSKLKVLDIFMGGGTTLVEGSRLGMQMHGNDLNPIAWLKVKNELSSVSIDEVTKLFEYIDKEVRPQIAPFYASPGNDGVSGEWRDVNGQVMGSDFDPFSVSPENRKNYTYDGPEMVYTFWMKHVPCSAKGCNHRTPLLKSPVFTNKTITVKVWEDFECQCGNSFDVEKSNVRISPNAPLIISPSETTFTVMDGEGKFDCPYCQKSYDDPIAIVKGKSQLLGKAASRKVKLHLMIHPDWVLGDSSKNLSQAAGCFEGSPSENMEWYNLRDKKLSLIEVRGDVPEEIICPTSGKSYLLSELTTQPTDRDFVCQESSCGRKQRIVDSIESSGFNAPLSPFAVHAFSESYKEDQGVYNGRYFATANNLSAFEAAEKEWMKRKDTDLKGYWPEQEIPFGHMTHQRQPLPRHGYHYWWHMFNARQLLLHAILLKTIDTAYGFSESAKLIALGTFQQYLRNQNMFCFWNATADKMEPMFSNNNFHPKSTIIENGVFSDLGRGNWQSCVDNTLKGLRWAQHTWETVPTKYLADHYPELAKAVGKGKGSKVYPHDSVIPTDKLTCTSSTDLGMYEAESMDLVITDPPFSGLIHYSELSDFFYVWLKPVLSQFNMAGGEYSPKTMEAVSNKARTPDDPDEFYKRLLTACWREANRVLKPGGIMAFTFHHSDDDPWVDVLESLFEAGFYLEATYPIRSDETKGKGQFGSKSIEYDIIHVCRKRMDEPKKNQLAKATTSNYERC